MRRSKLGPASLFCAFALAAASAQQLPEAPPAPEDVSGVPESVAVDPVASDEAIAQRLERILGATGWYGAASVTVDEGVVFLEGEADSDQRRRWAGDLAGRTQGVVAVVNRMAVRDGSMWDFSPAWAEATELAAAAVRRIPLLLLALFVLLLTWWTGLRVVRSSRPLLERRIESQLLRNVVSRVLGVPVFLLGIYFALRITGLTSLAMTVLGGTGIAGLIVGFAFRDIAENFLASLLISVQSPFATGDLISVAGYKGLVQSVNTRSTLLMTLEGNHVQIPNATIYKETIQNFTANPYTRFDFTVGIGYDDSIEEAQSIARATVVGQKGLAVEHEPWVIVDALGAATVNLKVYFWVDTSRFNGLKVRSAVIRAVKTAFEAAGVSMPDEAREVVFPAGVPVRMTDGAGEPKPRRPEREPARPAAAPSRLAPEEVEGDLTTEAVEITEQARRARTPEGGENLIS